MFTYFFLAAKSAILKVISSSEFPNKVTAGLISMTLLIHFCQATSLCKFAHFSHLSDICPSGPNERSDIFYPIQEGYILFQNLVRFLMSEGDLLFIAFVNDLGTSATGRPNHTGPNPDPNQTGHRNGVI